MDNLADKINELSTKLTKLAEDGAVVTRHTEPDKTTTPTNQDAAYNPTIWERHPNLAYTPAAAMGLLTLLSAAKNPGLNMGSIEAAHRQFPGMPWASLLGGTLASTLLGYHQKHVLQDQAKAKSDYTGKWLLQGLKTFTQ